MWEKHQEKNSSCIFPVLMPDYEIPLTSKILFYNRGMRGVSCAGSQSAGNQLGQPEEHKKTEL